MEVTEAQNQQEWDAFLASQKFSPFLQSWTMGNVYKSIGQKPIRLEVREKDTLIGICQAIVVPARRGRHLSISYGPILSEKSALEPLMNTLRNYAKKQRCSFLRLSPFWPKEEIIPGSKPAPLHLLAEHLWYLDLKGKTEEGLLKNMRKNTRNLIRRAGREGVEITASENPMQDIAHFLKLHEETRKRHHFTPYTDAFFHEQLDQFGKRNECTLYLAKYNGEVIAASMHMHMAGETSYHHGASTHKYSKIPASYLLQWTAITDALKRGDHTYHFWGIAPEGAKNHPFQGVTTFKTGFGGQMLELTHCMDVPLSPRYYGTRAFEYFRKWRRGF